MKTIFKMCIKTLLGKLSGVFLHFFYKSKFNSYQNESLLIVIEKLENYWKFKIF